jgi:hypothetical protein
MSIFTTMEELQILSWKTAFLRGKRALQHHDNELALKFFERALSSCPVSSKKELSEILYLLGSTLNKLGMRNCALKSWSSAGRLHKHGYAARSVRRFSNAYGMAKQMTSLEDDWKAFYSVQLYRYLCMKKTRRLGTEAERDMIEDLIVDAWNELKSMFQLQDLDTEEKMQVFKTTRIVFPTFEVQDVSFGSGDTIPVDFGRKQRVHADDHCFCGSGLPFRSCCGRIPGKNELLSGIL